MEIVFDTFPPTKVKLLALNLARSQGLDEGDALYDLGIAWKNKTVNPSTLDEQGYVLNAEQRDEDTKAGTLSTEVKITFTFLGKTFNVTYHVGLPVEISGQTVTLWGEPTVEGGKRNSRLINKRRRSRTLKNRLTRSKVRRSRKNRA